MNNHLSKADLYADAYKQQLADFNESKLKARLTAKFDVKPYYLANRKLYYFSKICSYAFNFLSVCTSFTFVFSLLSGVSFILSVGLALVVLVLIEALKQFLIPDIAKSYFQFDRLTPIRIGFAIGLIGISALCSYKGANLAIESQTDKPVLINQDSIKTAYTAKIEALEAKQGELQKIKYRGTTTRTAQRSIEQIQKQINTITRLHQSELEQTIIKNQDIQTHHQSKTGDNSLYFALLALIFDLGLLCSLIYVEYYDYRSLCDFTVLGLAESKTDSTVSPGDVEQEQISVQTEKISVQTVNTDYPDGDCLNCGKKFKKKNPRKKYCSDNCRLQYYNRKNAKPLTI